MLINEKNISNYLCLPIKKKFLKKTFVTLMYFVSFFNFVFAQNSSYNLNSIPINGFNCTGVGFGVLNSNSGNSNSAFGWKSLFSNTTSTGNSAFGNSALYSNTTGSANTAIGGESLNSNTIGELNTGLGNGSLMLNTTGSRNSAGGWGALVQNTSGSFNTSFGAYSLQQNTTGNYNTSVGYQTLTNNTSGSYITTIGYNTNVGSDGLTNATAIGNGATVYASNSIQLGNRFVTTVYAGRGTNAKIISGGLQIMGGAIVPGKVLMSDAFGNATWQTISGSGPGSGWNLNGNGGTIAATDFIGTTDLAPLYMRVNNTNAGTLDPIQYNSFYGILGGSNNTTGTYNSLFGTNANVASGALTNATAIGYAAVVNASNTIQLGNSSVTEIYAGTGTNAKVIAGGVQVTGGTLASGNVLTSDAFGNATWQTPSGGGGSGWSLTGNAGTVDGINFIGTTDAVPFNIRVNNRPAGKIDLNLANTFYGLLSGRNITTGNRNCGYGENALFLNTVGFNNSAFGNTALENNVDGFFNTALGSASLNYNTSGWFNTATGINSLNENTSGFENTAFGSQAVWTNSTGSNNTGIGSHALQNNKTGNYNTSLGWYAGPNALALTNSTAIGSGSIVNTNNKIRLGDATVTTVEGPFYFTNSDGRFKNNISETDVKGLEFINKLRPVVYNFDTRKFTEFLTQNMPDTISSKYLNKDFNASTAIRQSGFIAQEVEKAANEVGYDFNGVHIPQTKEDNYSLAYSEFVVPLVKAVQELSTQNQNLKQNNEKQNQINESLKKDIEELRSIVSSIKNKNIEGSIKITENSKESILYQNAPNPFNNVTTIRYSIPENAQRAFITITTLNGRKIKSFDLNNKKAENLEISGGQLSAGTYIYSLSVDNILIDSKKMILTK